MIELLLTAFILFLFALPLPALSFLLAGGIAWRLRRERILWSGQPAPHRSILWLSLWTQLANTFAGLAVAAGMALLVHLFIFEHPYLFLLNFAIGTAVACRWFDFTHLLYRKTVLRLMPETQRARPPGGVFAQCFGLNGEGPAFCDAGWLSRDNDGLCFRGVFTGFDLNTRDLASVSPASAEKIKIHLLSSPSRGKQPSALLFVLKDQFYPFKSRHQRDHLAGPVCDWTHTRDSTSRSAGAR